MTSITLYAQSKDSFLWGNHFTGIGDHWENWNLAADIDYSYPIYESYFTTFLAGRKHTKLKFTSPPEVFDRFRGYVSFYTSGFRSQGEHVESAKLRFYVQDSFALLQDVDEPNPTAVDWEYRIYTLSGHGARQRTYVGGDPGSNAYGFGDGIGYYDEGIEDWVSLFSGWGQFGQPTEEAAYILEEPMAYGFYQTWAATPGGRKFIAPGETDPYRVRNKWLEIDVYPSFLNNLGETHLRVVNEYEKTNLIPQVGNFNHFETLTIEATGATHPPELVINYVDIVPPAERTMNELRLADLSIQRHMQQEFDLDVIMSGVEIVEGYPGDTQVLNQSRNVSLEHVSTITTPTETGTDRTDSHRKWFVDVVCDRRGESQDVTNKALNLFYSGCPLLDLETSWINPPVIGHISFDAVRVFAVSPPADPDKEWYHNAISIDTTTMMSGG
jgi:hypothetical protein